MNLYPFKASFPRFSRIDEVESFFGDVREYYPQFHQEGLFEQKEEPSIFIYQILSAKGQHTGLIATIAIEDYQNGKILRHEHTLTAKVNKQMDLLELRAAIIKPVLLTYRPSQNISVWQDWYGMKNPASKTVRFPSKGEVHRFWAISDANVQAEIQELFQSEISKAYIADGHHRMETCFQYYQSQGNTDGHVLAAFFPTNALNIDGFHRFFLPQHKVDKEEFLGKLKAYAQTEQSDRPLLPAREHQMTMCLNEQWYIVNWKSDLIDSLKVGFNRLDANLLNRFIFQEILEVADIRSDQRVEYLPGEKGIKAVRKRISKNPEGLAFCLYPLPAEKMMEVADLGEVLPPKSTWFVPRLRNGMIVQEF